MSVGIAYNPCESCKKMDKCSICELTYYRKGCIKSPASEVAMEIFDKVDEIAYRYLNEADYSGGDMIYDLNELKKKRTEV